MLVGTEKFVELVGQINKESRHLDFKSQFNPESAVDWCELIKDIIAMANVGGGVLIFGVDDNGRYANFDRKIILTIDPAVLADKIKTYTNENFAEFEIREIKRKNKPIAIIVVAESLTPIAFTRNGADKVSDRKHKPVFYKGQIYFRHGAKSEPADTSDMSLVISKAVKRSQKLLMEGVRKISRLGPTDEVIVSKRRMAAAPSIAHLQKISESGRPITLTLEQFRDFQKEYPLEYKDVLRMCKQKKAIKQHQLQPYIDKCKKTQDLSINWRTVVKSLNLPFSAPNKYMYKQKVVDDL